MKVNIGMEQVGHTKIHKTKRNIGLLCAVLKVISYRLSILSLLINLTYHVV